MTIEQLIKELSKLDGKLQVIQAKDAEGNSFSPLSCISLEEYIPENSWSGELVCDDDVSKVKPNAVVLWPIN